eukprot:gnl/MRDRNA2_/MRDRNA2_194514_c0_seq1.p1 gnl/MRDRNA2_/MRDRNA2_194514_c0~~gnl/MRDRNA2_/MRDRNA2_194514_c0_seq1.p1  ORF type:complete len:368 (+),score=62.97 gnl/MRDRNA2_/MRDRNA2_194514_c0_seq1:108-1106(+)
MFHEVDNHFSIKQWDLEEFDILLLEFLRYICQDHFIGKVDKRNVASGIRSCDGLPRLPTAAESCSELHTGFIDSCSIITASSRQPDTESFYIQSPRTQRSGSTVQGVQSSACQLEEISQLKRLHEEFIAIVSAEQHEDPVFTEGSKWECIEVLDDARALTLPHSNAGPTKNDQEEFHKSRERMKTPRSESEISESEFSKLHDFLGSECEKRQKSGAVLKYDDWAKDEDGHFLGIKGSVTASSRHGPATQSNIKNIFPSTAHNHSDSRFVDASTLASEDVATAPMLEEGALHISMTCCSSQQSTTRLCKIEAHTGSLPVPSSSPFQPQFITRL